MALFKQYIFDIYIHFLNKTYSAACWFDSYFSIPNEVFTIKSCSLLCLEYEPVAGEAASFLPT